MATYKVIQDVEAEDKLIGPLTPRQFLYAGVCVVCLYLTYYTYTKGVGFLTVIFLPVIVITGFFAFPWGRDQPTEIWALAKIRFMIKPRRRIWNQSGVKELVTITAPKQMHTNYTKGLSQSEVQSRLRALADTIDSRGWAIKNSSLNLADQTPLTMAEPASDRLVAASALPQAVDSVEVTASDDILDEKNNATAGRVDSLINAASSAHRKKIVESLQEDSGPDTPGAAANPKARPNNYWFLNQPSQAASIPSNMVTFNTQVVTPGMAADDPGGTTTQAADDTTPLTPEEEEARLVAELETKKSKLPTKSYYGHLHTIQPLSGQQHETLAQPARDPARFSGPPLTMPPSDGRQPAQTASPGPAAPPVGTAPPPPPPPPVTPAQQAAILQLANNNDLNVATIAREAHRSGPQDEVVIKLH